MTNDVEGMRWDNDCRAAEPQTPKGSRELLEQVEVLSAPEGLTEVHIPPSCLWDCVDCFGESRVDASRRRISWPAFGTHQRPVFRKFCVIGSIRNMRVMQGRIGKRHQQVCQRR